MYFLRAPSHMAEIRLSAHGFGSPFVTWNAAMAQDAATMAFADFVDFDKNAR